MLEFWLLQVPAGVHLRVTAYPRRGAQGGAATEPEVARAAYGKSLQGLWAALGVLTPEELAKPVLLPAWEEEVQQAAREIGRARRELAVALLLLGAVGAYVQSTRTSVAGGPLYLAALVAAMLGADAVGRWLFQRRRRRNASRQTPEG